MMKIFCAETSQTKESSVHAKHRQLHSPCATHQKLCNWCREKTVCSRGTSVVVQFVQCMDSVCVATAFQKAKSSWMHMFQSQTLFTLILLRGHFVPCGCRSIV